MITWIYSCTANDNIWLVLVFHGIEGIGWEPVPGNVIDSYFNYIKSIEKYIWVATFKDVTKYIRERMRARIDYIKDGDQIRIRLSHKLDPEVYDLPLTLKTYIPETWESVEVNQGMKSWSSNMETDEFGSYVLHESLPDTEEIILTGK